MTRRGFSLRPIQVILSGRLSPSSRLCGNLVAFEDGGDSVLSLSCLVVPIGPDTNSGHFSIVVAPAPHLDGSYTIFGEVRRHTSTCRASDVLPLTVVARGQPRS